MVIGKGGDEKGKEVSTGAKTTVAGGENFYNGVSKDTLYRGSAHTTLGNLP